MTNDRMTNDEGAICFRHPSFGNSSCILHGFDLDPLFIFSAGAEAASGEFAGNIKPEQRAIAGGSERSIEQPLSAARLGSEAHGDVARHDFHPFGNGELPPGAFLLGPLGIEVEKQRAAQGAAGAFLREREMSFFSNQRSAPRIGTPLGQSQRHDGCPRATIAQHAVAGFHLRLPLACIFEWPTDGMTQAARRPVGGNHHIGSVEHTVLPAQHNLPFEAQTLG